MSRSQSTYRYVKAYPASVGYGPAQAVIIRKTDRVVGYVRRILDGSSRGRWGWVVYDREGAEICVLHQRQVAANHLANLDAQPATTDRNAGGHRGRGGRMSEQVDDEGQTLREVLLQRLKWEYGDEAPWTEMRSLSRLEKDVRRWFAHVTTPGDTAGLSEGQADG